MKIARIWYQKPVTLGDITFGGYWVAHNWVATATKQTKEEAFQFCLDRWKAEHVVEVPAP